MNANAPSLQLESARSIDALCDEYEAAWRQNAAPRIEDYLPRVSAELQSAALAALLRVDVELRRGAGQSVAQRDYQSRFGELADVVKAVFAEDTAHSTGDTSVSWSFGGTVACPMPPADAPSQPLPEKIGRFVVLGILGEGGFGRVYRAHDPQLDRDVAIKVPRSSTLFDAGDIDRFLREAKAAATMQHPNICPVYEVGTANGRPYIVMALVPGRSLADHIKSRKQPLPERQAAQIVRKIAQALELAHAKGIIHRDLKPANILVDRERKDIVVMDFGLARRQQPDGGQHTQTGVVMGTPAYMSPEQARGDQRAIGPGSDIYSLGVILYELLTCQRPFSGSQAEVLGRILLVEPPPPSGLRSGLDPRLEAVCLKAMAKDPAERYASMREFATALGSLPRAGAEENSLAESDPPPMPDEQHEAGPVVATTGLDGKFPIVRPTQRRPGLMNPAKWLWIAAGSCLAAALLSYGIWIVIRTPGAKMTIGIESDDAGTTKQPPLADEGSPEAKSPEPAPPVDNEQGWTSLFNGQDFAGWRFVGDRFAWKVENGELVVDGGNQPESKATSGWLMTNADYTDYTLQLEFKVEAYGNSGVGFRCEGTERQAEIGILDEQHSSFSRASNDRRTGALHALAGHRRVPELKRGQWNSMQIELRGRHLKTTVNGTVTLDTNLDDHVEAVRPRGAAGVWRTAGPIGLQKWTGVVRFRNIRIKELSETGGTIKRVNLLPLIDPARDSVAGHWFFKDGVLHVPDDIWGRIHIPYTPPREYELELRAKRVSGSCGLGLGVVVEKRQCVALIQARFGWYKNGAGISGIEMVDWSTIGANQSTRENVPFDKGGEVRILCKVSPQSVQVDCDGERVIDWNGDANRISQRPEWLMPQGGVLYLGSYCSKFEISKMELKHVVEESGR